MSCAIKVENLGKKYIIKHQQQSRYHYNSLGESLSRRFRNLTKNLLHPLQSDTNFENTEEFWALKDINFEIEHGDRVGIIGRNGAGKSTLLKILGRITHPSTGRITINGRVSSLLEVGTGFHPELTGRENIFLNGAILGMRKHEIQRKFDEIVDFAEVEKFLDTPVKHYSSGMYVRLAFAVAAHLEPNTLIVDEVLAVGDLQFQKKCMGKMSAIGKEGKTVLFVSHNMAAISALCSKAMLLGNGSNLAMGDVSKVTLEYLKEGNTIKVLLPLQKDELIIHEFYVQQTGVRVDHIDGGQSFNVNVNFELLKTVSAFRLGIYFKLPTGDVVFRSFLADWEPTYEYIELGRYSVTLKVPPNLIFPGTYQVLLHASKYGVKDYLNKSHIIKEINVLQPNNFNQTHINETFNSHILMPEKWLVEKL
ncbi:polysaccharide ABC transporter ATP-binding protein [Methylomonas sp. MED-D]|uniref:ABC transporter ATP-binding protein n=1 Tax=unclassified Methylomonas TaxID=2608980 RepID=UPI0028A38BBF|nr:polysaccharide ABC transporter ATP-binding protein [Methylomonas sp. MV1]MDT4331810.1 polysaccharide ABC transporter ATP-binding protein [Methylomonas sp. MV1]